jgi:hypothetical protein
MPVKVPPPTLAPPPSGIVGQVPVGLLRWAQGGAVAGQRHRACWWLCCRLRQAGIDDLQAREVLAVFAAACRPPADMPELERMWKDSARHQGYEPPCAPTLGGRLERRGNGKLVVRVAPPGPTHVVRVEGRG